MRNFCQFILALMVVVLLVPGTASAAEINAGNLVENQVTTTEVSCLAQQQACWGEFFHSAVSGVELRLDPAVAGTACMQEAWCAKEWLMVGLRGAAFGLSVGGTGGIVESCLATVGLTCAGLPLFSGLEGLAAVDFGESLNDLKACLKGDES